MLDWVYNAWLLRLVAGKVYLILLDPEDELHD